MRRILLYHIYPINHWKEITEFLFQKLPFHKIVVHVSLPADSTPLLKEELTTFFNQYPVDEVLFSANSGKGEVDAMQTFAANRNLDEFDLLTYMHCKGVTKPGNNNVLSWTKLLRYFIIEKMAACEKAFQKGYITFGINKTVPDPNEGFRGSNFFYEGNFVSLNLRKVDLNKAASIHLEDSYYGLEGFWGKLCSYQQGYTFFNSGINHYLLPIEEKNYTTLSGRMRYRLVKKFYYLKSRLRKAS